MATLYAKAKTRPSFKNSNLRAILDAGFPKITMGVRMKCIKQFEDNNEVELTLVADYAFYSKKYISGPDRL
jgi:hypothetical protein